MSSVAQTWVWKNSKSRSTMRMVLLRLADQIGHHGENGWPGIDTIAEDCLLSTRQVQKHINGLVELGEMLVFLNAGGSTNCPADRRPNRYEMPLMDGWRPPEWLTPKSDPFGYMKAVFALKPAETNGVNSETPREVNSTTPRSERGELHDTPGVNSRVERGELQGSNGVNSTTPDMPLDLPREKSSSAREPDPPADGKPDYSNWKPAAATIERIKKLHPASGEAQGITEEFLEEILPEFLTYAEIHLARAELEYKFMGNATRQFLRSKNKPGTSQLPNLLPTSANDLVAWAEARNGPPAFIGEDSQKYRERLFRWDNNGRPEIKPIQENPMMDLPGSQDDEVEEEMKRLHG